jgi:hypothetical protein
MCVRPRVCRSAYYRVKVRAAIIELHCADQWVYRRVSLYGTRVSIWDSSASIVTRLWAGRPRHPESTSGRSKRFLVYFPYFEKQLKVGLCDHHAVCVYPSISTFE